MNLKQLLVTSSTSHSTCSSSKEQSGELPFVFVFPFDVQSFLGSLFLSLFLPFSSPSSFPLRHFARPHACVKWTGIYPTGATSLRCSLVGRNGSSRPKLNFLWRRKNSRGTGTRGCLLRRTSLPAQVSMLGGEAFNRHEATAATEENAKTMDDGESGNLDAALTG
jgi:hypothetical protein